MFRERSLHYCRHFYVRSLLHDVICVTMCQHWSNCFSYLLSSFFFFVATFQSTIGTPALFICLYSLNNNKHRRFCKVTHTRDFHGLQLVLDEYIAFFTSLAKEVMFLVVLVRLSVCLSVDNITQKVMKGL